MAILRTSLLWIPVFLAVLFAPEAAFGRDYPPQRPGPLLAGFARVEITPPAGVPLGGYSSRFGTKSKGSRGKLFARAMVLDNGRRRVAVVTTDLIGIFRSVREGAIARLPRRLGLGAGDVLISATHNHSAQGGFAKSKVAYIGIGAFKQSIHDDLCEKFARAITLAVDDLAPARLGAGSFRAPNMSANRTFDGGATDPEVGMVKITDLNGALRGVLVNFAAHPTILDPEKNLAAPEYPGYLCMWLEKRYPGATAMFTQGAHGDQRTQRRSVPGDDFARCQAYGERLAKKVANHIDAVKTEREVHVNLVHRDEILPPAVSRKLSPERSIVQRLELGRTWLVTAPGEMTVSIGLKIKKDARTLGAKRAFIVSCANDHLGYFVDNATYRLPTYESGMTINGPNVDRWLETLGLGDIARERGMPGLVDSRRSPPEMLRGARFFEKDGVRVLALGGTPYEMGYQHGFLLREEIRGQIANFRETGYRLSRGLKFKDSTVKMAGFLLGRREVMPAFLAMGTRVMLPYVSPARYQEMQGVADGAAVSFNGVLALNALVDVLVQRDLSNAYKLPGMCTQWAAWGRRTARGRMLLGRTVDMEKAPYLRGNSLVILARREGGEGVRSGWVLGATFPGFVGFTAGVNDAGVAVSVESLHAPTRNRLDGAPVLLQVRDALDQGANLDAASEVIRSARGASDYHYLVASAKERDARVVEVSMNRSILRLPDEDFALGSGEYREARWFKNGEAAPDSMPRVDEGAKQRYAFLRRALPAARNLDAAAFARLMRDPSGGIDREDTVQCVIIDARTRTLHVAAQGAAGPWVEVRGSRLLDSLSALRASPLGGKSGARAPAAPDGEKPKDAEEDEGF